MMEIKVFKNLSEETNLIQSILSKCEPDSHEYVLFKINALAELFKEVSYREGQRYGYRLREQEIESKK